MTKKPFLILIAGGTASGKGSLVNSLDKSISRKNLSLIGIDYNYLAIEVKIKGVTWITKGKRGWTKKSGEEASDAELIEIKKARDEDVDLLIDMQSKWSKPESVDWDKLLGDIKKRIK